MWITKLLALPVLIIAIYIGAVTIDYISEDLEDLNNFNTRNLTAALTMSGAYSALVLGGTGGVGSQIVRALARTPQFEKVTLIGRKATELPKSEEGANYEKFDQKSMDFDKIPEYGELFKGYDMAFYAIGVPSASVSEEVYKKIELDNALALATLIKEGGIKDVHFVTGRGTKENAMFLFGRVKAQVEDAVSKMGFRRVSFYRPAGVVTDKPGVAGAAIRVMGAVDICNKMTVKATMLGAVIVANSLVETDKPVEILENADIIKIGKTLPK